LFTLSMPLNCFPFKLIALSPPFSSTKIRLPIRLSVFASSDAVLSFGTPIRFSV